jgi:hypothetical protein
MSALRTAAAKHTRSLSQPLRRTFYTPFAALQHSQLPTQSATATVGGEAAPALEHEHEHEHEHAARTVYVVAEPNAADFKFYGVPAGAYPVATPYNHHQYPMGAHSTPAENANMNVSLLLSAVFINVMRPLFACCSRARNTAGIDDASALASFFTPLVALRWGEEGESGRVMVRR